MRNLKWLIIPCLLMFAGCSGGQRLTKAEWTLQYPPDVNAVEARLMQEQGEAEIVQKQKDSANMASIERFCILGLVGAIVACVILAYTKLTAFLFIPASVVWGCLAGIAFLEFNAHYPKILPLAGGGFVLAMAAYFIFTKTRIFEALHEVVGNVENIKSQTAASDTVDLKTVLSRQSSSTKSLVAGIRAKINGSGSN